MKQYVTPDMRLVLLTQDVLTTSGFNVDESGAGDVISWNDGTPKLD
jgi:hypothetical protein